MPRAGKNDDTPKNARRRRSRGMTPANGFGTPISSYFRDELEMSESPRTPHTPHTYLTNEAGLTTLKMSGVTVKMPVKPYRSQMTMLDRMIKGLTRGQNCLIESPTGTGKTMALLSASLAWITRERERLDDERMQARANCRLHGVASLSSFEPMTPKPVAVEVEVDQCTPTPIVDDVPKSPGEDDFISRPAVPPPKRLAMDMSATKTTTSEKEENVCCTCAQNGRLPTIYYATRTHKQIAQVVDELRRTAYGKSIKTTILSSREYSCVNPRVRHGPDKMKECRELIANGGNGCPHYNTLKTDFKEPHLLRQLFDQLDDPVWDIEDLVREGEEKRFCSYFAATRVLNKDAELIFCPYNYLIDPLIRDGMSIDLTDAVVILDEAHNIEDSSREAASFTIDSNEVYFAEHNFLDLIELISYKKDKWQDLDAIYVKMRILCNQLFHWIDTMGANPKVNNRNGQEFTGLWSGPEIHATIKLSQLAHLLDKEYRKLMSQLLNQIIQYEDEARLSQPGQKKGGNVPKPVSQTMVLVEKLLQFLGYFHMHETDYKMCVSRKPNPMHNDKLPDNLVTINWWCMHPAVAFRDAFDDVRSIILASGTLSPMDTFQSELGITFQLNMEGNHVIPAEQIYASCVSTGPNSLPLRCVFQETQRADFQDELGFLLLHVCRSVPKGVLCFFPSYRLLEILTQRWKATQIWNQISRYKSVAEEPRFSSDLQAVMDDYYGAIRNPLEYGPECTGSLMLAICRGKVSEGLDFSDDDARAVVTVGIPFPAFKDLQVQQKRQFNDDNCSSRGLLSGSKWYDIQAYRALNQALGRCLRHRNDWGALIMVDARFCSNTHYTNGLSRWIRESVHKHSHFDQFEQELRSFVQRMTAEKSLP